ncbi:hypothetical protein [Methylobacterium oxalidis]|nr:hypothetical protein [Methylobacterium oxalidis]
MAALYRAGVQPENRTECVTLYIGASVERAQLTGELGVLDQERIHEAAALFGADPDLIRMLWDRAATEANASREACRTAAQPRFEAGHLSVIAHRPLVDLAAVARAYEKTEARDRMLFGRKSIPGAPMVNGKWPMTKRIHTGIPPWTPETGTAEYVREIPDGPGTDRFTTAERKQLAVELDVKTKTVREKERDLDPEAFDAWVAKRRKATATKAKNEAEKKARAGRRKRKPEIAAAVRAYAKACGRSERHAWRLCQGMTKDEILALIPRRELAEIGRLDRVSDRPETPVSVSRSVSRVSDNVSDKDPENVAFFHNSTPTGGRKTMSRTGAAKAPDAGVTKRKPKRHAKPLHPCERAALAAHYLELTGKTLTDELVRQWRCRRTLKGKLAAALEWIEDDAAAMSGDPTQDAQLVETSNVIPFPGPKSKEVAPQPIEAQREPIEIPF